MPLPSDALYALPKVHEDGSLEYTPTHADPPPEPAGWLRDPQNPWLFRPQWPECMLRMAGVRKTASGAIEVRMVCNNPAVTEHYMKYIKLPDCTSCTKRKNPA